MLCSAQVYKRAGCHLKRAHLVRWADGQKGTVSAVNWRKAPSKFTLDFWNFFNFAKTLTVLLFTGPCSAVPDDRTADEPQWVHREPGWPEWRRELSKGSPQEPLSRDQDRTPPVRPVSREMFPPQNSVFYLFRSAQQIVVTKVSVRMNDNVKETVSSAKFWFLFIS